LSDLSTESAAATVLIKPQIVWPLLRMYHITAGYQCNIISAHA